MKLQFTLTTLFAALAMKGFASASDLFHADGADDANQNIVGGGEVRAQKIMALLYSLWLLSLNLSFAITSFLRIV